MTPHWFQPRTCLQRLSAGTSDFTPARSGQGFSTGGKREQDDERNDLLLHFVRLVEELRPRTFCLENVVGLLEDKFSDIRESAFRRLREAGYALSGTDKPVNSLNFGVPQSRRRVIVLGALGNVAPSRPQPVEGTVSVEEAFEGLPSPFGYDVLLASDEVALRSEDIELRTATKNMYARTLAGLTASPGDKSRPRLWEPTALTGSRLTTHAEQTIVRFAATDAGTVEPKSRLYRLPLKGPSRTLRAGTGSERGCTDIPTGSASTPRTGTGTARLGTACHLRLLVRQGSP